MAAQLQRISLPVLSVGRPRGPPVRLKLGATKAPPVRLKLGVTKAATRLTDPHGGPQRCRIALSQRQRSISGFVLSAGAGASGRPASEPSGDCGGDDIKCDAFAPDRAQSGRRRACLANRWSSDSRECAAPLAPGGPAAPSPAPARRWRRKPGRGRSANMVAARDHSGDLSRAATHESDGPPRGRRPLRASKVILDQKVQIHAIYLFRRPHLI